MYQVRGDGHVNVAKATIRANGRVIVHELRPVNDHQNDTYAHAIDRVLRHMNDVLDNDRCYHKMMIWIDGRWVGDNKMAMVNGYDDVMKGGDRYGRWECDHTTGTLNRMGAVDRGGVDVGRRLLLLGDCGTGHVGLHVAWNGSEWQYD